MGVIKELDFGQAYHALMLPHTSAPHLVDLVSILRAVRRSKLT